MKLVAIAVLLMFTSCGFDAVSEPRPYAGEPLCPCADVGVLDGGAVCGNVESCSASGACRTFCAWLDGGDS